MFLRWLSEFMCFVFPEFPGLTLFCVLILDFALFLDFYAWPFSGLGLQILPAPINSLFFTLHALVAFGSFSLSPHRRLTPRLYLSLSLSFIHCEFFSFTCVIALSVIFITVFSESQLLWVFQVFPFIFIPSPSCLVHLNIYFLPVLTFASCSRLPLFLDCPSVLDFLCRTHLWTLACHFHEIHIFHLDPSPPRTNVATMVVSWVCKRLALLIIIQVTRQPLVRRDGDFHNSVSSEWSEQCHNQWLLFQLFKYLYEK